MHFYYLFTNNWSESLPFNCEAIKVSNAYAPGYYTTNERAETLIVHFRPTHVIQNLC